MKAEGQPSLTTKTVGATCESGGRRGDHRNFGGVGVFCRETLNGVSLPIKPLNSVVRLYDSRFRGRFGGRLDTQCGQTLPFLFYLHHVGRNERLRQIQTADSGLKIYSHLIEIIPGQNTRSLEAE
jgi:hypothetical protein